MICLVWCGVVWCLIYWDNDTRSTTTIQFFKQDGAWLGSPSRDSVSTPSTGPSTPSGCGCLNMTSASTQRTAALETKDALFSSKKRNIRKFPNIATGAGGHVVESEQREKDVGRGIVFGCGGEVMNSAEGKSFSLLHTVSSIFNLI